MNKFDEMLCKLDSSKLACSFEQNQLPKVDDKLTRFVQLDL